MEERSGRVNKEVVLRLKLSRGLVVAVALVPALVLSTTVTAVLAQSDQTTCAVRPDHKRLR